MPFSTRFALSFLILALLSSSPASAQAQSGAEIQELLVRASKDLAKLGRDTTIIAAVRTHNSLKMGLAEIRRADAAWPKDSDSTPLVRNVLAGDVAKYLKKVAPANRGFIEVLLMGGLGELVAATNRTSDYWQGDEPKWQRAYAGGKGSTFVDRLRFDESTRAKIAQISVPVMDGNRAIGAITFGIDVARYR